MDLSNLLNNQYTWLVTGAAGFIGVNICKTLIHHNQIVFGFDNLSTGSIDNIKYLEGMPSSNKGSFIFIEDDINNIDFALKDIKAIDYVLHQAALGSVPRSISFPHDTNHSNVSGFLKVLDFSKNLDIKSFVYASSSSVYGDNDDLPKREQIIGSQLSPYAVTKYTNELYANVYASIHGINVTGLRYFNVFGPHQNPNGPYAAVIPKWIISTLQSKSIEIFGDGSTSRDFCYVDNAVQANIASAILHENGSRIFNIACSNSTSLNQLAKFIQEIISSKSNNIDFKAIKYSDFRVGDIKHSLADIIYAKKKINYDPADDIFKGLEKTIDWFIETQNVSS